MTGTVIVTDGRWNKWSFRPPFRRREHPFPYRRQKLPRDCIHRQFIRHPTHSAQGDNNILWMESLSYVIGTRAMKPAEAGRSAPLFLAEPFFESLSLDLSLLSRPNL